MALEPWQTVAVVSITAPISSANSMPFFMASQTAQAQPYRRDLFEFARIRAASFTASSIVTSTSLPFLRIMGDSILWCPSSFEAPTAQACLTSTTLLFCTSTVISSHRQPQHGHNTSVIIVILLLIPCLLYTSPSP